MKRTAYATIPPRVDYELTEAGHSLTEPLRILAAWARSRQAGMEAAQREFDARFGDPYRQQTSKEAGTTFGEKSAFSSYPIWGPAQA